MSTLHGTIQELKRIFDEANKKFFDGKIENVEITVQTNGRKKNCLGWATVEPVWDSKDNIASRELNLCAEHIGREPQEIVATLLHEMVHILNAQNEVKDCNAAQYHNKSFKGLAESAGLLVEKFPGRGWAKTSLNEDGIEFVKSVGVDSTKFVAYRKSPDKQKTAAKKANKYSCGCSKFSSPKELDVKCNQCGKDFEKEEA